jgi:hypothetical protein
MIQDYQSLSRLVAVTHAPGKPMHEVTRNRIFPNIFSTLRLPGGLPMTIPLLRLGSSGPHVRDVQTAFNAALFPNLNLIIGAPRGGLWDRQ